jgi:hypothetical protein
VRCSDDAFGGASKEFDHGAGGPRRLIPDRAVALISIAPSPSVYGRARAHFDPVEQRVEHRLVDLDVIGSRIHLRSNERRPIEPLVEDADLVPSKSTFAASRRRPKKTNSAPQRAS